MAKNRLLLFLTSLIIVPTISYFVILFARGYRFQPQTPNIVAPTGLLAANSYPDGAQIFINNQLKSATNTTISLSPGEYEVEIKKDGFAPWKKQLRIQAEIVTQAWATLFPTVPSLKAITFSGAANPITSPDGNKVAFIQYDKNASKILTVDLSESPLSGINRESRLIATFSNKDLSQTPFVWSPDSKQLLVMATPSAYLVDTQLNQSITPNINAQALQESWQNLLSQREAQKFTSLPTKLQEILSSSATHLIWSPKETKLLYTATASATIADNLKPQLPGSSTQPQTRTITPGNIYVYDLEEDRNFLVAQLPQPTPTPKTKSKPAASSPTFSLAWHPSSSHLIKTEPDKITIFEYDNTNPVVVYAGPMAANFSSPYPSGRQLAILINLNPTSSSLPNLYALSLK